MKNKKLGRCKLVNMFETSKNLANITDCRWPLIFGTIYISSSTCNQRYTVNQVTAGGTHRAGVLLYKPRMSPKFHPPSARQVAPDSIQCLPL